MPTIVTNELRAIAQEVAQAVGAFNEDLDLSVPLGQIAIINEVNFVAGLSSVAGTDSITQGLVALALITSVEGGDLTPLWEGGGDVADREVLSGQVPCLWAVGPITVDAVGTSGITHGNPLKAGWNFRGMPLTGRPWTNQITRLVGNLSLAGTNLDMRMEVKYQLAILDKEDVPRATEIQASLVKGVNPPIDGMNGPIRVY